MSEEVANGEEGRDPEEGAAVGVEGEVVEGESCHAGGEAGKVADARDEVTDDENPFAKARKPGFGFFYVGLF